MLSIAVSIKELLTSVTVTLQSRVILSFLSLLQNLLTSIFDYSMHTELRQYGILDITATGSNKSSVPNVNPWYLARHGKHEFPSAIRSMAGTCDRY